MKTVKIYYISALEPGNVLRLDGGGRPSSNVTVIAVIRLESIILSLYIYFHYTIIALFSVHKLL